MWYLIIVTWMGLVAPTKVYMEVPEGQAACQAKLVQIEAKMTVMKEQDDRFGFLLSCTDKVGD